MAETNKVVIDVELNVDKTKQKLLEIQESLSSFRTKLQEQKKALADATEAGNISAEGLNRMKLEIIDTESKVKALSKEQSSYQLALTKSEQAQMNNTGSLARMRAELSTLTQIYGTKTAAEKTSDAATIKMGETIRKLSDTLKEQEKELGNNARNVGNYEESIKKALGGITLFGVNIGEVRDQLAKAKEVMEAGIGIANQKREADIAMATAQYEVAVAQEAEAAAAVVSAESNLAAAQSQVTAAASAQAAAVTTEEMALAEAQATVAAEALATAEAEVALTTKAHAQANVTTATAQATLTVATGTTSAAFNILKIAIASTGIGLLIIALGSLVAYFGMTKKGTDMVSEGFAAVKAAVEVIINRFAKFGEAVLNIFSGNFKEGARQMIDAFKGLGQEIADEAGEAYELKKALHDIEDAENDYIVKRQENETKIAELRLKAKDNNLPLKERADALKEAIKLEEENTNKAIEFAKARLAIAEKEFEDKKKYGTQSREDEKEIANARAEVLKIEAEGYDKQRSRKKELNSLLGKDDRQRIADEKQNANDAIKIQEDLGKARAELLTNQREKENALAKVAYEKDLATIKAGSDKEGELKQVAFEKYNIQLGIIKKKYDDLAEEAEIEHQKTMSQATLEGISARNAIERASAFSPEAIYISDLKLLQEKFEKEIQTIDNAKQEKLRKIQEEIDAGKILKENGINEMKAIENTAEQAKLAAYETTARAVLDKTNEYQLQQIRDKAAFLKLEADADANNLNKMNKARLAALKAEYEQEKQDLIKKYSNDGVITEQGLKALENLKKKYGAAELAINKDTEDQKLANTSKVIGQTAALFGKQTAAYKLLATTQAVIDTYRAATAALAPPPVGYGPLLGPIAVGVIIASGLANVAKIQSAQFYDGGYTGNGNPYQESRALGPKPYIYHQSEYVVPAKVLSNPVGAKLVETLEVMRTSGSFKGLSHLPGFAEGGRTPEYSFIAQQATNPEADRYATENALIKAALLMPSPIVTVEDINTVQNRVAVTELRANV